MTIYSYCLNNWLKDEYKKDDTHVIVGNKFQTLTRKHNRIFRSNSHKSNNSLSPDEFLFELEHHQ